MKLLENILESKIKTVIAMQGLLYATLIILENLQGVA